MNLYVNILSLNNKMIRLLTYFILFVTLSLFFSGCEKPPELDKTPFIEFPEISNKHYIDPTKCNNLSGECDTILITIYFKDGDGDIGLTTDDNLPPYHAHDIINNDTLVVCNFYHHNYHINMYSKCTPQDTFELYDFGPDTCLVSTPGCDPCDGLNGRIGPLYPEGYSGPLEGTIEFKVSPVLYMSLCPDSMTFKFEIQLVDRALNKSNIVETSPITILK